jgi:hypothetical protein
MASPIELEHAPDGTKRRLQLDIRSDQASVAG